MKVELCFDPDWLVTQEAFRLYSACMYNPTYDNYKERVIRSLSDLSVKIYVCEEDNKRIGIMVIRVSDGIAEIIGLAVSENFRNKGIGRYLVTEVVRSEDLSILVAQTDEDSIDFYRKCGFDSTRREITFPDGLAVRYDCILNGTN